MRLTFKFFDGRRATYREITDEETGKTIGHINSYGTGFGGSGGIDVSLLGGKYSITVNHYAACWGFVKGVEAVLNHMTQIRSPVVEAADSQAA